MTIFSKFECTVVRKLLESHNKCDLMHSGGCALHALKIIPEIFASNCKYFVPMVILQLLLNIKKINNKVLLDAVKYYWDLVYTGTTVGYFSVSLHCFFKVLLRGFNLPGVIFLPSTMACHIILWTGKEKAMQLFISSSFQALIETKLLQRSNFLTKAFHDLVPLQTVSFMVFSALILYAKQQKLYKGFWCVQPAEEINNKSANSCQHESVKLCRQYWLEGLRINAAVGLTLDLFRMFMDKTPKHIVNIFPKLIWKLKHAQFNTTSFLTSYVLIYRMANCLLLRNSVCANPTQNQILAAFLGGFGYVFYANISMFAFALIICGQIFWSMFKSNSAYDKNLLLYYLKKVPFITLVFPPILGYLTHKYAFGHSVSKLSKDMINNLTSNYSTQLKRNIHALVQKNVSHLAKSSISA